MIALKKLYGDELLRLALVLSLLKADPNEYLETETQQIIAGLHRSNGTDWSIEQEAQTLIRPSQIHPKSLDHILAHHERQLFDELNSLGRYNLNLNNGRILNNYHTYLVNNVATETVAPALSDAVDQDELIDHDGVSADDNVAEEVKIEAQDEAQETPELVVTLSQDYLNNRTEPDIFAEIASRSFDVNEFLVTPEEMVMKKKANDVIDVEIKKETEDMYSDNAIDDFVPYFEERTKLEIGEPNSVLDQNIADLQDYPGYVDDGKLREIENDSKPENLEKYLISNTPFDVEELNLGQLFDDVKIEVKRERASTSFTSASSSGVSEMDASVFEETRPNVKIEPDEGQYSGDELTQEDMDLIDVLWKQDVDMGFSVDNPVLPVAAEASKVSLDDIDKELKRAEEKIQEEARQKDIEKVKATLLDKEDDPWAGLSYVVDTETGEYILQGELPSELVTNEETRFDLLEEALELVELGDAADDDSEPTVEGAASPAMLHPAMARGMPHPLAHYHNQSLMRSMSSEQRWQDLASLLSAPPPTDQYGHYHQPHHNHNMHAAATSYAPNYGPIPPPGPDKHHDIYASAAPPLDGAYKVEAAHLPQQHDGLYYQTPPAELGPTNNDGFLQSILNDEDLQLMDMAVNEGMYTMRILDGGTSVHHAASAPHHTHSHMMMTERDSASDSAVSSMGSERVPSLSDGEWGDAGDSTHEYLSSKFRPYEASYGRERGAPQKKHHMFGKRCFQEPAPVAEPRHVKFEPCAEPQAYSHDIHMHAEYGRAPLPPPLELNVPHSSHTLIHQPGAQRFPLAAERVRHNHTYTQLDARTIPRERRVRRVTEESMGGSSASGHMTRDEKRAKALGIPIEVHEIINLPMDEFNERLSKHDLSEAQLSLIRDIRRRGKNKVAAQNCRKRKLDQITSLADEVRCVKDRKQRTQREHQQLLSDRQRIKERFAKLYRHVFQNLRDAEGRPLSSAQYSLQQAADGNVVLVPRMPHPHDPSMNRNPDDDLDRKTKTFDQ